VQRNEIKARAGGKYLWKTICYAPKKNTSRDDWCGMVNPVRV